MGRYTPRLMLAAAALIAVTALGADLDQAKRDGLVGERADGYLGLVVTSAPDDVVKLIADVNARRKTRYLSIAERNGITLEQVQALAGKKAIEKTRRGDRVFLDGRWRRK